MTGEAVIICDRLVQIFPSGREQVVALRGVDLTVMPGETVALLGPSGAGKSTLLTLLAGLTTPTAGTLEVLGHDMASLSERRRLGLRGLQVGLLLQNPGRNLLGWATAAQNVLFAQQASRRSRVAKRRHTAMLLDAVGIAALRDRPAGGLSGGEQQRLGIAVALANAPELLLADEPTSQLDAVTGTQVLELLRAANADLGTTVVVVTHDPAIGAALGRTVTIADGRVGAHGQAGLDYVLVDRHGGVQLPPEAQQVLPPGTTVTAERRAGGVLLRPVNPPRADPDPAAPTAKSARTDVQGGADTAKSGQIAVKGTQVAVRRGTETARAPREGNRVQLSARSVRYDVGPRVLFAEVDLTVRGGELLAVTGPSGSGKTALLTLLAGLETPANGTITLDDTPVLDSAVRGRIGVLLQGYGLVAVLTAAENVEIALRGTGATAADARLRAGDLLAELDLHEHRDHLAEELSGGQQQRLALARALAVRPAALIVDEPTAEQDGAHRAVVLAALSAGAREGAAVVLATHDLDIAAGCDWEHRIAR